MLQKRVATGGSLLPSCSKRPSHRVIHFFEVDKHLCTSRHYRHVPYGPYSFAFAIRAQVPWYQDTFEA
jgi:hypothetical protein